MNVVSYVKGLAKSFPLSRVREDVRVTSDELLNTTIIPVEKILKLFPSDSDFKSQTFALYNEAILAELTGNKRGSMYTPIHGILKNAMAILSLVDGQLSADFSDNVTQSSITLSRATTLQLLDTVNFVGRYTRRMTDAIFIAETNASITGTDELKGITEGEIRYLSGNRDAYIRSLKILKTPVDQIESMLKELPEVVVADMKSAALSAIHGNEKMDPLRFGFVESRMNPIWRIGNAIADYQATRYKTAKQEKEILEIRIERYKAILARKPDPTLARIIEGREAELDRLRGKLAKWEREND